MVSFSIKSILILRSLAWSSVNRGFWGRSGYPHDTLPSLSTMRYDKVLENLVFLAIFRKFLFFLFFGKIKQFFEIPVGRVMIKSRGEIAKSMTVAVGRSRF